MTAQHYLKSFNKNQVIGVAIALIVFLGIGYWAGAATHATAGRGSYAAGMGAGSFAGRTGAAGGAAGARGSRAAGFAATTGSILSVDGNSLTITIPTGGTKIVYFASSTSILKSVAGAPSDLSAGTNVIISGTTAPDGSVVAQSIQVRPAGSSTPMMQGQAGAGAQAGMQSGMPMQPAY